MIESAKQINQLEPEEYKQPGLKLVVDNTMEENLAKTDFIVSKIDLEKAIRILEIAGAKFEVKEAKNISNMIVSLQNLPKDERTAEKIKNALLKLLERNKEKNTSKEIENNL